MLARLCVLHTEIIFRLFSNVFYGLGDIYASFFNDIFAALAIFLVTTCLLQKTIQMLRF